HDPLLHTHHILSHCFVLHLCSVFFFTDTATTEIYTLSLHDALPICGNAQGLVEEWGFQQGGLRYERTGIACDGEAPWFSQAIPVDRKSTRLNSSHSQISYAVFCLKKKKKKKKNMKIKIHKQSRHSDY